MVIVSNLQYNRKTILLNVSRKVDCHQFLTHLVAASLVWLGVVCSVRAGPQSAVAGVGEAAA